MFTKTEDVTLINQNVVQYALRITKLESKKFFQGLNFMAVKEASLPPPVSFVEIPDGGEISPRLKSIGFPTSSKTFQVEILDQQHNKTDFSWLSLSKVRGRWDRLDERSDIVDRSARTGRRHVTEVSSGGVVDESKAIKKCNISYISAEELGISESKRQEMLPDEEVKTGARLVDLKREMEFSTIENGKRHSFKTVPRDRISFKTTRLGQLCGRNEISIKVMKESKILGGDTLGDKSKASGFGQSCIGWFKVAISGEKIWMVSSSSTKDNFIKSATQIDNTLKVDLA